MLMLSTPFYSAFSISYTTPKHKILFESDKQPNKLSKSTFENNFESEMNPVHSLEFWQKPPVCNMLTFENPTKFDLSEL